MISKGSFVAISLLFGVTMTTVIAFDEYEYDARDIQIGHTQNNNNEEIYNPALLQQQEEENERILDMDTKTEVSLKSVRNIPQNQLSNEYISMEHEDENNNKMAKKDIKNTYLESTDQNIRAKSSEKFYETDISLIKNNRNGRFFTTITTTTLPPHIRRLDDEHPSLTQKDIKDINVSSSDYVEDDGAEHIHKDATKISLSKNLDNSSEENDDIVPLGMKFYEEISPENASSTRHIEEVSSEDYYEEEYREPELRATTISTAAHTTENNIPHSLSTGYTTNSSTISLTRTTAPPTQNPLSTTSDVNIPIMGQFDPLLITTFAPLAPLAPLAPASPPPQIQIQPQTMLGITTTSRTASVAAAVATFTPISDKKGKQIPIVNTVPVSTTTTTMSSRRRLLPHEQLRNYIEDAYIRMPLAVIVDPSSESLEKTKTLWNDALRSNFNIKIVLVTLNEHQGLPAAFNFNNTRQFLAGLNSIKEQNSGDVFRGISHAAELVPYDSAVFISTAQLAKHTDQVQDSAITLLKKRIRLYLIWFGERSLTENETQDSIGGILGEVVIRSGGEILHIISNENSHELEGSSLTIVADALRGSQEVDVPVDTTLSSLHVKIDKLMRRAVMETPNGG